MPGFDGKAHDINALNVGQVATLADYVIDRYGRADPAVTDVDVAEIRAGGPTSPRLLCRADWHCRRYCGWFLGDRVADSRLATAASHEGLGHIQESNIERVLINPPIIGT
jgi:hypothetical protein